MTRRDWLTALLFVPAAAAVVLVGWIGLVAFLVAGVPD